eukprot:s8_g15.t1
MQVKLRKEAKSSLGIKLMIKEMCPGAVISEVQPTGLVGKWNAKNPSDAIAVSDRLLAVNGLTDLKETLAEDLTNETELELTFLKRLKMLRMVAFSSRKFSAENAVGVVEANLAIDEEFEQVMHRMTRGKTTVIRD